MMQRFDNEYMMRTSEAPALRKLPSDYMRDCFRLAADGDHRHGALEQTMRVINAETHRLFVDYRTGIRPASTIYDLPS